MRARARMSSPRSLTSQQGVIQRACAHGNPRRLTVQRRSIDGLQPIVPTVAGDVLQGQGQQLDITSRRFFEPWFGHDFSRVRVHADRPAAESAQALDARAYTLGTDIVFGAGAYEPATKAGRELLAHELTHVVQQDGLAPVNGDVLSVSSPGDPSEAAADSVAHAVHDGGAVPVDSIVSGNNSGTQIRRDLLDAVGTTFRQLTHIDPRDANPIGMAFNEVVSTNAAMASASSTPPSWTSTVLRYAANVPLDGAILLAALMRSPALYRGGWILDVQPGATAMTLDFSIFARGRLSLATLVHELVHVFQYALSGVTAFLISYFGLSAATIAYRWATGQPLRTMRSSPHEAQAYGLESRFKSWHQATYGTDPDSITI